MQQADSVTPITLRSLMTKYKLDTWWKIIDLKEGKEFLSEQMPLHMVNCIQEYSINAGHLPLHNEVAAEVGQVRVEVHTGTLWVNSSIEAHIEDPDRIILFKRVSRGAEGQVVNQKYFIGLANSTTKDGIIAIIQDESEIIIKNFKLGGTIDG